MMRPFLKARADGQWCLAAPYVNIVWVPIGVFIFIETLVGVFAQNPSLQFAMFEKNSFPMWSEAAARLQFFGLFILFLLSSWLVVFKFAYDLVCLFDCASRKRLLLAFGLCAAVGAAIVESAFAGHLPRSFDYFGTHVFRSALREAATYGRGGLWGPTTFLVFIKIINISAIVAVPSLIAGGISCLGTGADLNAKQHWILQRERLQNYIYLSGALLVIAVVFLKVWTQYPASMLTKDAAAAYNSVVNSYAVLTGIEYTTLLAAYALPVSLFLSRQADQIALKILLDEPNSGQGLKIRDIREREKLMISSQDTVKFILALLSPLITGSIATLASI